MFDRRADIFVLLQALYHSRGDFSRDHGVFRIIFKISAATDISVDIHGGREPKVALENFAFSPHNIAAELCKFGIPALCNRRTDGNRRGILIKNFVFGNIVRTRNQALCHFLGQKLEKSRNFIVDRPHSVRRIYIFCRDTQPCGTVGEHEIFSVRYVVNVIARFARSAAHMTGRTAQNGELRLRQVRADTHMNQLLVGQRCDDGINMSVDVIIVFLRRKIACGKAENRDFRKFFFQIEPENGVLEIGFAQSIFNLFGHDVFQKLHNCGDSRISARIAYSDDISSLFQNEACAFFAIGGNVLQIKRKRNFLFFVRLQLFRLYKGRERLAGFL